MLWFVDGDGSFMIRVRGRHPAMRSFLRNIVDGAPIPRPATETSVVVDGDTVVLRGMVHTGDVASMTEYLISVSKDLRQR